jgi:hypothetical protein
MVRELNDLHPKWKALYINGTEWQARLALFYAVVYKKGI